ncbi:MAG: TIGR00341 family protein [Halieaceae bacterium]
MEESEISPPQCCLLFDSNLDETQLEAYRSEPLELIPWSDRETIADHKRVLLCLSDEAIRDIIGLAVQRHWQLAVLPHPDASEAMNALSVKGSTSELLAHYQSAEAIEADVLLCNDQPVFSSVIIGKVMALRPADLDKPASRRSFFLGAIKGLRALRLKDYRLTTGKDQQVQLAALGLVVMGYTRNSLLGRFIKEPVSLRDGRLTLLAFAPRSITSYLWFLLRLVIRHKVSLQKLPSAIGVVQTERITLSAPRGVEFLLDSKPVHAEEIEFRIQEEPVALVPGPALQQAFSTTPGKKKDAIRIRHLPINETARELFEKPLPMFSHATEEEYRDLFVALRENAMPSTSFQVLTVLSVLLALAGMYANSAPVIIGAMILAPLMSPIISMSMGMARMEFVLLRNSMKTLAIGIGWALGWAVLVAWLMPLSIETPEMQARMSPTLLDLFVAVISGIAGAYAFAKEEIAKSLAGVAIAVALVPPLSVMGIGLGWADWDMAIGATLLFSTNLIGIALAASVTFLVLGFAPFHLAKRGLMFASAMMVAIAIPLTIAFSGLTQQGNLLNQVPTGIVTLGGQQVRVGHVEVIAGSPPLVRLSLSAPNQVGTAQVDELKQLISERVGETIELEADVSLRR